MQKRYRPLLAALAKSVKRRYGRGLVSLVVFGSVARGQAGEDSDVDCLIVCDELPRGRMLRAQGFARGVEKDLAPVLGADALILHDRRGFFRGVLGAMKARLDELGARRVYQDRRWYWILKPDFKPGEVQSYLVKARTRLLILDVLLKEEDFSDVVREAQEAVELALKAVLRSIGIEPPKWHDVGSLIVAHKRLLPAVVRRGAARMAEISKRLRKERELAFYGDMDFIPTEEYTAADAARAIRDARWIVSMAGKAVPASE